MAILYEATGAGGGHIMNPAPDVSLEESDVVEAVNGAQEDNDEVASLFGIQRWSNVKTTRVACPANKVGNYGIGTWQSILNNPTAQQEAAWGWWQSDVFKLLGGSPGYDVDFAIKYDPSGSPVTLGGYLVDTTTGYLCIKFANYVPTPSNAKVFVDVTITRNDVIIPT